MQADLPTPNLKTLSQMTAPAIKIQVTIHFKHVPNPVPLVSCAVIINICFLSPARMEFAKAVLSPEQ